MMHAASAPAVFAPHPTVRTRGRDEEAALLRSRVAALGATGRMSVTLVTGEPGIGKSHQLRELRALYGSASVPVAHAEAKAHDPEPLSAWLPLLARVVRTHLAIDAAAPIEVRHLRPLLGAQHRGHAPELCALLETAEGAGGQAARRSSQTRHPELEREMFVLLICEVVRASRPHLLVVDAAENFKEHAWATLKALVEARPAVAIVLGARSLHTWCDGGEPKAFKELKAVASGAGGGRSFRVTPYLDFVELELLPLSTEATAEMLRDALGDAAVTPQLIKSVHERCDGNPLFVRSTATSYLEAGSLAASGAAAERSDRADFGRNVKELVLAQVDRLPVQAQVVVKTASVLGARFEYSVLIGIYPGPPADVDRALDSDAVKLLLVAEPRSRATDDKAHAWRSTAVRDIVYNLMLLSARQRLHLQAAEFYERVTALRAGEGLPTDVGMSARHYAKSDKAELLKAEKLLTAGRAAIDGGDYADGENWLDQCRTVLEREETEAERDGGEMPPAARGALSEVLCLLAEVYTRHGRPPPEGTVPLELLRRAHAYGALGPSFDGGQVTLQLGWNDQPAAVAAYKSALAAAPPRGRASVVGLLKGFSIDDSVREENQEESNRWTVEEDDDDGEGAAPSEAAAAAEVALAKVECHFLHSLRERERAGRPWLVAETLNGLGSWYIRRAALAEEAGRAAEARGWRARAPKSSGRWRSGWRRASAGLRRRRSRLRAAALSSSTTTNTTTRAPLCSTRASSSRRPRGRCTRAASRRSRASRRCTNSAATAPPASPCSSGSRRCTRPSAARRIQSTLRRAARSTSRRCGGRCRGSRKRCAGRRRTRARGGAARSGS